MIVEFFFFIVGFVKGFELVKDKSNIGYFFIFGKIEKKRDF